MMFNIRKSKKVLRAKTNGCYQDTTHVVDLPGFFQMWHNEELMLNFLSFTDICNKFRVTMDTRDESAFVSHLPNGKNLKFKKVRSGLYLYNYENPSYSHKNVNKFSFLVQSRLGQNNFTRLEVNLAE